jgi:hypothetical protein
LWVELPDLGDNTLSIGIVFVAFIYRTDLSFLVNQSAAIESCSVFTNWKPVDLYTDPSADNGKFVHSARIDDDPYAVMRGLDYLTKIKGASD